MDFEDLQLQNAMAAMSGGAFTAQSSVWTLGVATVILWMGGTGGLPALVPLTWCPQLPIVAAPFCHWKSRMKFFGQVL